MLILRDRKELHVSFSRGTVTAKGYDGGYGNYVVWTDDQNIEHFYGHLKNPSYNEVCSGKTGHVEAVEIKYDSKKIPLKDLFFVFFNIHDPTTLNRQGNDVGTQYRSVIFYHNNEQKEIAEKSMKYADSSKYWKNPIVTEITMLNNYSDAEDYHDNYYDNNPNQPYCLFVIRPKLNKLQKDGVID